MKHKQINSHCSTAALAAGSPAPSPQIAKTVRLNLLLGDGSRPTLTLIMDAATRIILGVHVSS